nr:NAD(P)-binding domain-containing protein [Methanothermobacter sp. THM-2]
MLGGLQRAGRTPEDVMVCDTDGRTLKSLEEDFSVNTSTDCRDAEGDLIFLALHPPAMKEVLTNIKPPQDSMVVSLAPRISMGYMQKAMNHLKVARVIPNAPSIINRGYNPFCISSEASQSDKENLKSIFDALGDFPEVDEEKLEAYAIITAMGPTYLWFQLDELERLAVEFGMDTKEAKAAVSSMTLGAVEAFYSYPQRDILMDLIPIKPLSSEEAEIRSIYRDKLTALYRNLKEKL